MRVLLVNKYLYPKGGSETHLLALAEALEAAGHAVHFFGTQHPANVTPSSQTVAVPAATYDGLSGWSGRLRAIAGMLFSLDAYRQVRRLERRFRPQLAHLHNVYHQLSPSVLMGLKHARVPCVLTAHDYKLVCPSYSLYDGRSLCFACRHHRYWQPLLRGCSRHGWSGGLALATEAYVHHFWRVYERHLDLVIAPSRFMRDRLVEGGFPQRRIRVLPNAVRLEPAERVRSGPGQYLLFAGRLSYEKGLPTLLEAAAQVPHIPLWIAGDGPLRSAIERRAADLPHVRLLGAQPPAQIKQLLAGCRALVLPSEVPENCPLSVLEAFAAARPVLATRVGGVPELVEHGTTGLLVTRSNAPALAAAMQYLWADEELCVHCGDQARTRVEAQHDLNGYLRAIQGIYGALVAGSEPPAEPLDLPDQAGRARVPAPATLPAIGHVQGSCAAPAVGTTALGAAENPDVAVHLGYR